MIAGVYSQIRSCVYEDTIVFYCTVLEMRSTPILYLNYTPITK